MAYIVDTDRYQTRMITTSLDAMVTSSKAYRTDLPRYHTFLTLHPSASFITHDSV